MCRRCWRCCRPVWSLGSTPSASELSPRGCGLYRECHGVFACLCLSRGRRRLPQHGGVSVHHQTRVGHTESPGRDSCTGTPRGQALPREIHQSVAHFLFLTVKNHFAPFTPDNTLQHLLAQSSGPGSSPCLSPSLLTRPLGCRMETINMQMQ